MTSQNKVTSTVHSDRSAAADTVAANDYAATDSATIDISACDNGVDLATIFVPTFALMQIPLCAVRSMRKKWRRWPKLGLS
ncbi:hypothetical protein [Psychrobacter immobilis]|uniref:hypothetical protein n=1 Tax=Psychrobacter immobilis TaxID=498 RepID=UPI0027DA13D7|nr:hypothetical protein [Psychrobacter immobilis]